MEIVIGVIEILSCLSDPSCNYIDRHRKFETNVEDLRRRVKKLNSQKEDIQTQLKAVDLSEKQVRKEVEDWFGEVNRIINVEIPGIEEKVRKVSYLCRGRIGELVSAEIETVEEIYQQGNSLSENLVIDRPQPLGIPLPVGNLEGEVDAKEQIWGYLNNEEVGVIGLWGIGGVGKTTITKHIHNELVKMEPRRFDIVIWVTVSQPLSIRKLQNDIASELKKSLPEDGEELLRAAKLLKIMEGMKFVLILDDVWDKLSLEDVGIPKPTKENGCKVMVTSRSANVCNFLGCRLVKVNPLSSEESLNLFLDTVGLGSEVVDDCEFGKILKLVVKECDGLPLAIVVIAGTMKGVSDICEWRNALRKLRNCVAGGGLDDCDKIFNCLKFSYDRLPNSKIQNCFLWCSLYPEDFEIERIDLIEHWIDDGLIEESTSRREMHDQGHTILNRLESNCLLEKGIGSRTASVKMHDVVRDMALHIKSTQFMVKAGIQLKRMPDVHEWATNVEKVSLMFNDIVIPPNMSPKCPGLSSLLLQRNFSLTEIPDCFFSNMPGLKVLNLFGCSRIEVLPAFTSDFNNLTSLILRQCSSLKHVPSLVELKALKKLDLNGAAIETLPEGVEALINLQYLDLNCVKLVDLPVGMLGNLTRLQYLHAPPNVFIKGEEVARLRELETIICKLELADFNNFVCERLETCTNYDLLMGGKRGGKRVPYYVQNPISNKVTLIGCEVRGGNHLVLPDILRLLEISQCNLLRSLGDDFLQNTPNKLTSCSIEKCEGMECMVDMDSLSSSFKLNNIEHLSIQNLPNLQVLVKWEELPKISLPVPLFPNLTGLLMDECPRMKKLISLELLQSLRQLEKIYVRNCLAMEEIIGWEEEESGNHTNATNLRPLTPKLKLLELDRLPVLRRISPGRQVIVFDSLESIYIINCPKLKRIPLYLVGDDDQASPPPALEEILVYPRKWWESLEWDDLNTKNVLQPLVK